MYEASSEGRDVYEASHEHDANASAVKNRHSCVTGMGESECRIKIDHDDYGDYAVTCIAVHAL